MDALPFLQNVYNTQKRIPGVIYSQLKKVAKSAVIKVLEIKGKDQESLNIG